VVRRGAAQHPHQLRRQRADLRDPAAPGAGRELRETRDRKLTVAIAELGYLQSKRWTKLERRALATTVRYSYAYLFDPRLEPPPQEFDALFRRACDLHHVALADLLRANTRVEAEDDALRAIEWYGGRCNVRIGRNELSWSLNEYAELHVADDYRVEGLPPPASRRGIGVPCILRRDWNREAALAGSDSNQFRFLPSKLAFATTLVVHFPDGTSILDEEQPDLTIDALDPTRTVSIEIEGKRVPLEIDYVTPIAALLSGHAQEFGIAALLQGDRYAQKGGLYMFQPYQKDKILVLFVHGLASDPFTWLGLYADLLSNETVRTRYQFAFWFYPTGQPVFYSAEELRRSLTAAHQLLDPDEASAVRDDAVVCGHSMGGILTRTLVTDTGDTLWDVVFDRPPDQLALPEREREMAENALIFEPLPFVKRVIFYATPHRGSPMADMGLAEWASGLFSLPQRLLVPDRLRAAARPEFRGVKRMTSIQSLRDDSPVLLALADLPIDPRVTYHSIIGDEQAAGRTGGSDGVVPYFSSHVAGAESELIVHSGHSVQRTPQAARETLRILLEHLEATGRENPSPR
jgi:pimeloyl-ACP methyl ester carboxylesterase